MGGMGSGRHWHLGANDATDDYRPIDVRHWQRKGLLAPHQSFGWQWLRDGEFAASIRVRSEPSRVILSYRCQRGDGDWKCERFPVFPDWTPCHLGGSRPWFLCPAWVRPARRHPLRRCYLRLSALLSSGLPQFTRGCRRPRNKARR